MDFLAKLCLRILEKWVHRKQKNSDAVECFYRFCYVIEGEHIQNLKLGNWYHIFKTGFIQDDTKELINKAPQRMLQ